MQLISYVVLQLYSYIAATKLHSHEATLLRSYSPQLRSYRHHAYCLTGKKLYE